jgi:hypothetical protein
MLSRVNDGGAIERSHGTHSRKKPSLRIYSDTTMVVCCCLDLHEAVM